MAAKFKTPLPQVKGAGGPAEIDESKLGIVMNNQYMDHEIHALKMSRQERQRQMAQQRVYHAEKVK